jgi:hypothetical protein
MKLTADRSYADPQAAARDRQYQCADGVRSQGRRRGTALASSRPSSAAGSRSTGRGTFVKFTQTGAELFA